MCEMKLELNSPITEEQWDLITDVDFDKTNSITFHTKHGKEVEFVKPIELVKCKDCIRLNTDDCPWDSDYYMGTIDFCSWGEREDYVTNKERLESALVQSR